MPIEINLKNEAGRVALHLVFSPPQNTYNGLKHGVDLGGDSKGECAKSERPEGIQIENDWIKPGDLKKRRECALFLIESGANVAVKDFHDFTCLHYAALYGWKDVLDAILHADAEISPTTITGTTPLMLACSRGHHIIVTTLLEEGGQDAGIEHRDGAGMTALLLSIVDGSPTNVRLLLEAGADPNACNMQRESALVLACTKNDVEIINLLMGGLTVAVVCAGARARATRARDEGRGMGLGQSDKTPERAASH